MALKTACYIFILTIYCDVTVYNFYVAIIAEAFITVYGIITIMKCCKKKKSYYKQIEYLFL